MFESLPRASIDCVTKCEVLNGSNVVRVHMDSVHDDEGSGWVTLRGNNGRESKQLRDLGDNKPYLATVRDCAGRSACESCVLAPYTKEAYAERGELDEINSNNVG